MLHGIILLTHARVSSSHFGGFTVFHWGKSHLFCQPYTLSLRLRTLSPAGMTASEDYKPSSPEHVISGQQPPMSPPPAVNGVYWSDERGDYMNGAASPAPKPLPNYPTEEYDRPQSKQEVITPITPRTISAGFVAVEWSLTWTCSPVLPWWCFW